MDLVSALRLGDSPRLAFVGAGGKSNAMFRLARRLKPPVVVTTTTHIATHQTRLADVHVLLERPDDLTKLVRDLPTAVVAVTGPLYRQDRYEGPDHELLVQLHQLAESHHIAMLVEADGSRRLPLKAPAGHEPALPGFVETVVVVAGMSALGKPLDQNWVHRPERFSACSGISQGETITAEAVTRMLLHPAGGLQNIPQHARRSVLLAQASTPALQAVASQMAGPLLESYDSVVVADLGPPPTTDERPEPIWKPAIDAEPVLAVHEPVVGLILAAGESRRLGKPKQTLVWRGEPLVRHVARAALAANLAAVKVVTGAHAIEVGRVLTDLSIDLVHNANWAKGQSESLKTGVQALSPNTGAAIFLLVDQPQIPRTLIRALVETHSRTLAPIVAPQIDGQRGNPVLFDRVTFSDLLKLSGDVGGRSLFSRYPVTWVPWHDASLLLDVDTPADYERLLAES